MSLKQSQIEIAGFLNGQWFTEKNPYVLIDTLYNTRHAQHETFMCGELMSEEEIERKIAVIFATDVVGYSKHMEAEESSTIKNLSLIHI